MHLPVRSPLQAGGVTCPSIRVPIATESVTMPGAPDYQKAFAA